MNMFYHPSNANVAAGSLSRLSMGGVPHVLECSAPPIEEDRKELAKDIHKSFLLGS